MKNSTSKVTAAIATRAYAIWEAEGRPHGRDAEHWLRAETEMTAAKPKKEAKKSASGPKAVAKKKPAKALEVSVKTGAKANGASRPALLV